MRDNRERNNQSNNKMLRIGCVIYMLILLAYTAGVRLTGTSVLLFAMYCGFAVANLILSIVVFTRSKESQGNPRATQALCCVFEWLMLSFFAAEGVFPFPDTYSLYVPIALLLLLQLFIHGARYSFALIVCYCACYAAAAALYKAPAVAADDARIAAATLLAALIDSVLLSNLRAREGRAMKNLEYLSTMDSLTGVYNRQTVDKLCDSYVSGRSEKNAEPYALILIDLDQFKSINDTYGHIAGDEALAKFGALLKASFYDRDFVGRYGGDEFLVVMRGPMLTAEHARKKAMGLLADTKALAFESARISLTCSIGIAYVERRNKTKSVQQILSRADQALYAAKKAGRAQIVLTVVDPSAPDPLQREAMA